MTNQRIPDHPFRTSQARRYGLNPRRLRQAEKEGKVKKLLHGVYVRGDIEVTTSVRLAAAALVMSRHAVACDRTAAWIWGVDSYEFRELDVVPALETYVLRGTARTQRREVTGGTRDLVPEDWVEIEGVKVTTPLRTAMDLGCKLNRRPALAAMDALMRTHKFTHAEMRRLLPRYFRRRGVIQLRELIPLVDPRAESPGESWTRLEIHDHGLPAAEPQFWVEENGVRLFRIDLAYAHAKIAVEYDGEEFHTSEEDKDADEKRREWLERRGWTVIVVTKDSFAAESLAAWIGEIRDALAEAHRVRPRIYS